MEIRKAARTAARYGLYPLLLGATLAFVAFELSGASGKLGRYSGLYSGSLFVLLVVLERLLPMRDDWGMTARTFFRRDLPYLAIGATTLGIVGFAASWFLNHFGISRASSHAALPLVPSVVLVLIIPEFVWYWVHRWSHESRGRVGRWLWTIHLPHHMPRQLYVLMHAVSHPLNTLVVRLILTAPLFFLGFSAEAMFAASMIVGLQGLVSHFNVDLRVGWFNYVLVGTELHRYHHSADVDEAGNFGNVVPLWDLVFGTFVYRPGEAPRELGVAQPARYPDELRIGQVLALPFGR